MDKLPSTRRRLDELEEVLTGQGWYQKDGCVEVDQRLAALLSFMKGMVQASYKRGREDGHGEHSECLEAHHCLATGKDV